MLPNRVASGSFFQVLRVRPAVGRFFAPDEDVVPGAVEVLPRPGAGFALNAELH